MVWKAISSITPIMLPISLDERSISPMAVTARPTTACPSTASLRAALTTPPASTAFSAERDTVAVICSRAAAVSSRAAACCSVRRDRSLEACEISWALAPMALERSTMTLIVLCSLAMAALKSARSFSYSGAKVAFRRKASWPFDKRSRPAATPSTTSAC
ncbi:hypothetical protein D3C72_1751610 [compost metagenome]